MKNTSLLCIVTITKNDSDGLKQTISSVDKLINNNSVNHIIVDASKQSVYHSNKRISGHSSKICSQLGTGISNAFNQGIKLSKGEWIWFLNSGDTMLPTISPDFLLAYLRQSVADVIIFDYQHGSKRIFKPPLYALWPPVFNWIPHPSTIIRSTIFAQYGLFNESYKVAMDGELWFRILSQPQIKVDLVSLPLTQFDTKGISSTSRLRSSESLRIIWQYKQTILRRWFNSAYLILRAITEYIFPSKI